MPGFRHEYGEDGHRRRRDRSQEQETGIGRGMVHDRAGDDLTGGGADADRGADRPECDIEAPGAPGEIGDDEAETTPKIPAATPSRTWIATRHT